MTDYQTWIARGPAVCDAECAQAMGWEKNHAWSVGHFDKQYEFGWVDADGEDVAASAWSPTTDRNACARVLKRVADEGRAVIFDLILAETIDNPLGFQLDVLLLDPSMLCWCALEALKEEA
jgi:hypothetical protein